MKSRKIPTVARLLVGLPLFSGAVVASQPDARSLAAPGVSRSTETPPKCKKRGHMEHNRGAIIRLVDEYLKRHGLTEPRGSGPTAMLKAESYRALRDGLIRSGARMPSTLSWAPARRAT